MPTQDQTTVQTNGKPPVPTQPTGSFSKEADMPRNTEPVMEEIAEYEVPKEVSSHVAKVQEHIEIPPDLKNIGVTTPHSHGKVSDALQKDLKLPLTDDQIGSGLKTDMKSSFRWLAEWCVKQLKRVKIQLKPVGQHYVREKK